VLALQHRQSATNGAVEAVVHRPSNTRVSGVVSLVSMPA
jgi:hypothetical protein